MDSHTYRCLQAAARRLAPGAADAEDLVQDTLVAALRAGRDDLPWLHGVLRKQAALQARGAVRRRRREHSAAVDGTASDEVTAAAPADRERAIGRALHGMPPAARRVAVLALHGLSADEIRWLLGLSATAFRQRLTSIRRSLGATPAAHRSEQVALAYLRDPARSVDLEFGLLRRALRSALRAGPGLGTHDQDGHLLVIRDRRSPGDAHVSGGRGND